MSEQTLIELMDRIHELEQSVESLQDDQSKTEDKLDELAWALDFDRDDAEWVKVKKDK